MDKNPLEKLFDDDELDNAVMGADDTGMVSSEHVAVVTEIEDGIDPEGQV